MSNYERIKWMKRINTILKSLVAGICGFMGGIFIIVFCSWISYYPETLIGQYCLLFSPIILALASFLYVLLGDIYLFRKEW